MNKEMFLTILRERLSSFPQDDINERMAFYEEMIDDRIEEGMTEEEAVASVGTVDEIVSQITSEIPLTRLVIEKVKPDRSLKAWEIVLLILGFPVWFPILVTVLAVLLSVYIVIWSLVLVVYAVTVSFAVGAIVSIPTCVLTALSGKPAVGLLIIGAGVVLAGLAILMFYVSAAVTKGMLVVTKKFALWVKSLFVGKEDNGHAV